MAKARAAKDTAPASEKLKKVTKPAKVEEARGAAASKKSEIDEIFAVGKKVSAGADADADAPAELQQLAEKIKKAREAGKKKKVRVA